MPVRFVKFILLLMLLLTSGLSQAQETVTVLEVPELPAEVVEEVVATLDTGDTAWMLVSSALVLLMVPGLALFYGGMVRQKNVLSTMMHSFIALGVMTIHWVTIGYSLAFGSDIGGVIGNPLDHLFLRGILPTDLAEPGLYPKLVFVMFQGMFAIITPALISGAIAERVKFSSYIVFILLWATFVYCPLAHMVWGGGLLKDGLDFAGGTVVHFSSGVSALVLAVLLGKRYGYPGSEMNPHNLTMTLLGAGLLWFGWFGFNAGSALAANGVAGLAFATTHIAAAAGVIGWLLAEKIHHGRASALGAASGLVAGLVGITPAAGFVMPWAALMIGFSTGLVCYLGVLLKGRAGYDDSLDAFGVHGIGGAWGAVATGIFAAPIAVGAVFGVDHMEAKSGLVYSQVGQFVEQIKGVAAAGLLAAVMTTGIYFLIKVLMGFRVDPEQETLGIDVTTHREVGYSLVSNT